MSRIDPEQARRYVVCPDGGVRAPDLLRVRRLEQGLTLKQLAAQCREQGVRVSVSELSRIERYIHAPRPALRKMLAGVLGVTVTDFKQDPDEGTEPRAPQRPRGR